MKFPGRRKSKHYFPVDVMGRPDFNPDIEDNRKVYIVGIDQLLVDIEVEADLDFLDRMGLTVGESSVLADDVIQEIYKECINNDLILGEFAGGAVGNTLHNYSTLSDDRSVMLGTICSNITVGDYAFKYICNTSSKVDFSHLQPIDGHMARAICFVTPDHERTFAIGKGIMNELQADFIPQEVIANSSALLLTAFLLRDRQSPMYGAAMKAIEYAKNANVQVVLALGTSSLIEENQEFFQNFINEHVNIVAMNAEEAAALTGLNDPLLSAQSILDICDLTLLTVGASGLYICSWADQCHARQTKDMLYSKSIPQYNKYEYSRGQKKSDCKYPTKIYSHINPFMGGPLKIENTNGAGDSALAALLHDMSANDYHQEVVPNSPKHKGKFLTYSSIHQICKYANRASYEVLKQRSPRLSHGLPDREESLEQQSYWSS
ncbi:MAG: inosine/guanosine kinase [bacterium]|nr:inosine/guanosine kinase [bacterium]